MTRTTSTLHCVNIYQSHRDAVGAKLLERLVLERENVMIRSFSHRSQRTHMHPNTCSFRIDPTPRRADGEYMAHARISTDGEDGSETEFFASGDLAAFDRRDEAIAFAKKWAQEWLQVRFG